MEDVSRDREAHRGVSIVCYSRGGKRQPNTWPQLFTRGLLHGCYMLIFRRLCGGGPWDCTVISWDWGYLSIHIQSPSPSCLTISMYIDKSLLKKQKQMNFRNTTQSRWSCSMLSVRTAWASGWDGLTIESPENISKKRGNTHTLFQWTKHVSLWTDTFLTCHPSNFSLYSTSWKWKASSVGAGWFPFRLPPPGDGVLIKA